MMKSSLLSAVAALGLAGAALPAAADFSGAYDPSNWQTLHVSLSNPSDIDAGFADTIGAPSQIKIVGSDETWGGTASGFTRVEYTIAVPTAATIDFSWQYQSFDQVGVAEYDLAGFMINGSRTQLSNLAGGFVQSSGDIGAIQGHVAVLPGDTLSFWVETLDNTGGSAHLTISGFTVTPAVPEPGSLGMLALGLVAVVGIKSRRRSRRA